MTANTRSREDAADGELHETVAALRARVADLEKVVEAVGGEVGVGRTWWSCPNCPDGVVLVCDARAVCTDCAYVRSV
jgi:hypothetical protein